MYKKKELKILKKTYGLGYVKSQKICKNLGLNLRKGIKFLSKRQRQLIVEEKKLLNIGKQLKRRARRNQLFSIRLCRYKGLRNMLKLPCRGQRTKTNGKTKKKL